MDLCLLNAWVLNKITSYYYYLFLFHLIKLARKSEASKRFECNSGLPGVDETPSQGQPHRPRYVTWKSNTNVFPGNSDGFLFIYFILLESISFYKLSFFSPFSFFSLPLFFPYPQIYSFMWIHYSSSSLSYWNFLKLELALITCSLCLNFRIVSTY